MVLRISVFRMAVLREENAFVADKIAAFFQGREKPATCAALELRVRSEILYFDILYDENVFTMTRIFFLYFSYECY